MPHHLPTEVIEHILSFLPPLDPLSVPTLLACTLTSKRLSSISHSSLAWAPHLARWTDVKRGLPSAHAIGAQPYYKLRHGLDKDAIALVKKLARATHGRTGTIGKLVDLSLNVVDRLREATKMEEDEEPEEWMAMRYWATKALGVIMRAAAVETWERIREDEDDESLFDAVAAFSVHRGASPARMKYDVDELKRVALVVGKQLVDPTLSKNSFDHLSTLTFHLWGVMRDFAAAQGANPFMHTVPDKRKHWDQPRETITSPSIFWIGILPVAVFVSLVNCLPTECDIKARVISTRSPIIAVARRSDEEGEEDWHYMVGPPPQALRSRATFESIARGASSSFSAEGFAQMLATGSAAQMAITLARNISRPFLDAPPGKALGPTMYAVLSSTLLAPASEVSLDAYTSIFRETERSFPYDVSTVQRYFLPRCDEVVRSNLLAICENILLIEAEAPSTELETWICKPRFRVGQIVTREGSGVCVICQSMQIGGEWANDYGMDDGYVLTPEQRMSISYFVLDVHGELMEVAEDVLNAEISDRPVTSVLLARGVHALERAPDTGRYFRAREGMKMLPSAWWRSEDPGPCV